MVVNGQIMKTIKPSGHTGPDEFNRNILSFTTMKTCPISKKLPNKVKFLPNSKIPGRGL